MIDCVGLTGIKAKTLAWSLFGGSSRLLLLFDVGEAEASKHNESRSAKNAKLEPASNVKNNKRKTRNGAGEQDGEADLIYSERWGDY